MHVKQEHGVIDNVLPLQSLVNTASKIELL